MTVFIAAVVRHIAPTVFTVQSLDLRNAAGSCNLGNPGAALVAGGRKNPFVFGQLSGGFGIGKDCVASLTGVICDIAVLLAGAFGRFCLDQIVPDWCNLSGIGLRAGHAVVKTNAMANLFAGLGAGGRLGDNPVFVCLVPQRGNNIRLIGFIRMQRAAIERIALRSAGGGTGFFRGIDTAFALYFIIAAIAVTVAAIGLVGTIVAD